MSELKVCLSHWGNPAQNAVHPPPHVFQKQAFCLGGGGWTVVYFYNLASLKRQSRESRVPLFCAQCLLMAWTISLFPYCIIEQAALNGTFYNWKFQRSSTCPWLVPLPDDSRRGFEVACLKEVQPTHTSDSTRLPLCQLRLLEGQWAALVKRLLAESW